MAPPVRVFVVIALACASALGPRRAHAGEKADALVNQAVELRRNGDDEGALALLLQSYALGHAPRTVGQLGLCEQALGRWADAEFYLTEALKAASDAWVKKNRRPLEDALAVVKSHIARVEIQGEPEGAEVWVNGALVGKLPLAAAVRVSAGEVDVELRAPGFVREGKTMRLEAGQYQRIVLRAIKQPAPAPPPPAPPAPVSSPQTTTVVVNVPEQHPQGAPASTPDTEGPAAGSGRLALKWVAWGLGAAGLGVGVYGAIANSNETSAFDKAGCSIDPKMGGAAVNSSDMKDPGCEAKKSSYESKAKLAIGGFVAGGVLVATGLVLWLTEPGGHAHGATALACAPAVTDGLGPALGCALRF